MNPNETYHDTLEHIFTNSDVERKIDNLFDLETIGITEQDMSDYDARQIKRFEDSIKLKDGHYEVDLPWKDDLITKVQSNHEIALAVLHRLVTN